MVSPEDHDDLKVISEAREKLDKCVVPSMPCSPKEGCSGKLAVLPMFCCLVRPEATLISNSSGEEGQKHQNHMDHIAEKRHVLELHYGMAHTPISIKEATKDS